MRASRGRNATSYPAAATSRIPSIGNISRASGAFPRSRFRGKGLSAVPLVEAIHEGKIKGLISICFNPTVSLPDGNFVREALEKLEFFVIIDFFLSETARYADIVLPGSLMEEDEGTTTNVEGRVIHHRKVVSPPGDAREDWKIICELARRGSATATSSTTTRRATSSKSCASHPKAGSLTITGSPGTELTRAMGVFWPCPEIGHPGHATSLRRRQVRTSRWQSALSPRRVAAVRRDARRRVPDHSDHGPRRIALSSQARKLDVSADWWTSTLSRSVKCIRDWPGDWA